jgi:nucleotide-binding universal stress UspA family protein
VNALFDVVVAGVDGRPEGRDALALAARLCGLGAGRLMVVAAYPYAPLGSRMLEGPTDREAADRALQDAGRVLGAVHADLLAMPGSSPGRTQHEVAEAHRAALIVVGSSAHGPLGRLVLGGVTAETLRRAPCAVAVAPRGWANGPRRLARIGIAIDGSPRDASATAIGQRLAASVRPPATVQTIHVETPPRGAGMAARPRADVVLQGIAADQLAEHSAQLDLLVLGSRGRGRLGSVVLGSVAAKLVGLARCPVVALPAEYGVREPVAGTHAVVAT